MSEIIDYLQSLERFGVKPGLERIEVVMAGLGHPERSLSVVHVAGTNGKGSVSCMVERVLREAGHKTGLYTSPHMIDFRERIQVAGKKISEEALAELVDEVRTVSGQLQVNLTFFEFVTVVALLYFARVGVEIAVVEVGMGGLLDATNVVRPEVAVVTNVGLDHTEFLGESKEQIAEEKAGVFKEGAAAITGEGDTKVLSVLRERAEEVGVELVTVADMVEVAVVEQGMEAQEIIVKELRPHLRDTDVGEGRWEGVVRMKLVGEHQAQNAAVAVAALGQLRERGWQISWEQGQAGLSQAQWPGRLEVLGRQPLVVADAAHNEDGLVALGKWLDDARLQKPSVLLVGIKQGREVGLLARELAGRFDHVIVSEADFMAEEARVVARELFEHGVSEVEVALERGEALERAQALIGQEGMILVTGSIYFVGDMMKIIQNSNGKIKSHISE